MEASIQPTTITSSYKYDDPKQVMRLGRSLREISSLAYQAEGDLLITNNDESGHFFKLERATGKIIEKVKFGKDGDYEGIEILTDKILVVRNTGTLYIYDPATKETERLKNPLKSENDVEGLAYDPQTNKVLIACKGKGLHMKHSKKKQKYVYEYDLESQELDTVPRLVIAEQALTDFVRAHYDLSSKAALEGKIKRVKGFAPSGIAVHPLTQDYYVISARESLVVRIGRDKKIKEIGFLQEFLLPQPEGITFTPDGDLFLSSEGKKLEGRICRFSPI